MKRIPTFFLTVCLAAVSTWGATVNVVPRGYTFSPEAGSSVEVLSEFSVTTTQSMFLCPSSRKSKVQINGETVETITRLSGPLEETLTWILAEPVCEPGEYIITIPSGTFWDFSEEDNDVFVVSVLVTGGEAPAPDYYSGEMTTDPSPGYVYAEGESVSRMAVMSPKLTSLYVGPEAGKAELWKASAGAGGEGEKVDVEFTLTQDPDSFNEAHVVWVDFAEAITAPGVYTLHFPARAFVVAKYPDNWYTAPLDFSFTIEGEEDPGQGDDGSGISAVVGGQSSASFHTLDGRVIPEGSKPAPGLYIRSGRKVIIK